MVIVRTLVLLVCSIYLAPYVNCYKKYWEHGYYRHYQDKKVCKAEVKEPWSYSGKNGPEFWGDRFPTCNGKAQSPIDISTKYAIYDPSLEKLALKNYNIPVKRATIQNTGHTVEVTPMDGVERTIFVEDSLYSLEQLHFHWGDEYHKGAEHTFDRLQYELELHFVHRNKKEQIAVVSVLFEEHSSTNSELQKIIRMFPKVMFNNTNAELKSDLKLNNLLPENPASFYRYSGSLTTPACTEGVTWSVLTKHMHLNRKQLSDFRKLYAVKKSDASSKCRLVNNFRPVQPLYKREVFVSK